MTKDVRTLSSSSDVATIDAEHQVQIGLIRALEKALQEGDHDATTSDTSEILAQLKAYTNAHFLGEQLLMRAHAYEDYERHCQEHEKLLGELANLQKSFASESAEERMQAVQAFEEHLTRHIAGSDHALEHSIGDYPGVSSGG